MRLKTKLKHRIEENASCPDPGHDKAIDQLRNALDEAADQVRRHCGDPETLAELGLLGLFGAALLIPAGAGGLVLVF
jgi:hypothetical protein